MAWKLQAVVKAQTWGPCPPESLTQQVWVGPKNAFLNNFPGDPAAARGTTAVPATHPCCDPAVREW